MVAPRLSPDPGVETAAGCSSRCYARCCSPLSSPSRRKRPAKSLAVSMWRAFFPILLSGPATCMAHGCDVAADAINEAVELAKEVGWQTDLDDGRHLARRLQRAVGDAGAEASDSTANSQRQSGTPPPCGCAGHAMLTAAEGSRITSIVQLMTSMSALHIRKSAW